MNEINMMLESLKWNRLQEELHPEKSTYFNHRKIKDLCQLGRMMAAYNKTHEQQLDIVFENGFIVGVK